MMHRRSPALAALFGLLGTGMLDHGSSNAQRGGSLTPPHKANTWKRKTRRAAGGKPKRRRRGE